MSVTHRVYQYSCWGFFLIHIRPATRGGAIYEIDFVFKPVRLFPYYIIQSKMNVFSMNESVDYVALLKQQLNAKAIARRLQQENHYLLQPGGRLNPHLITPVPSSSNNRPNLEIFVSTNEG